METVLAALQTLYTDPKPEAKQQANEWLQSFQKEVSGWPGRSNGSWAELIYFVRTNSLKHGRLPMSFCLRLMLLKKRSSLLLRRFVQRQVTMNHSRVEDGDGGCDGKPASGVVSIILPAHHSQPKKYPN
jgi:hypothetical protein